MPTVEISHGHCWRVLICSTAGEQGTNINILLLAWINFETLWCQLYKDRIAAASNRLHVPTLVITCKFHHRWSPACSTADDCLHVPSAAGDHFNVLLPLIACIFLALAIAWMFCHWWSLAYSSADDCLHVLPPAGGTRITILQTSRSQNTQLILISGNLINNRGSDAQLVAV